MSAVVDAGRVEEKAGILREAMRLAAREEDGSYGWYHGGVRNGGLISFVRRNWGVLEPQTPFVDGWVLWAMCEHLEAVSRGEIKRLLINVPPGSMKSLLVSVFWPAWEWGALGRGHMRYVTFSYSAHLTMRDNERFRRLVLSREYQSVWGDRVRLEKVGEQKITNTATGWKIATSVGGVGTGERGNRIILDDPHNVKEQESDAVRGETIRWFRESMSNRLNDMERDSIVVIMQRVHEGDVSGTILDLKLDYEHLMIPMEYDESRVCRTGIGWCDPREGRDGELCWPARFPERVVGQIKKEMGSYGYAAQYQQAPAPRGGGIFERRWWKLWESEDRQYPPTSYRIASLDAAYTEKEENDPSALTVWGVFDLSGAVRRKLAEEGLEEADQRQSYVATLGDGSQQIVTVPGADALRRRFVLMHAWRKHLKFEGTLVPRQWDESYESYRRRLIGGQAEWGLVEWVAHTCRQFRVHMLLIEGKASGLSAAQALQGRFALEGWGVQVVPAKGDKVSRAMAVVPTFSQGLVYAPDKEWAQMVIDEMAVFPKHRYDDLTDSSVHALNYLKALGYARSDEEAIAEEYEEVRGRSRKLAPLYPC